MSLGFAGLTSTVGVNSTSVLIQLIGESTVKFMEFIWPTVIKLSKTVVPVQPDWVVTDRDTS